MWRHDRKFQGDPSERKAAEHRHGDLRTGDHREGTGNKTIVSTFNTITVKRFPGFHAKISIYAALTNATGKKAVRLRLRPPQSEEAILDLGGTVEFIDPNQVVELIFNIRSLPLPIPGVYAFEILADDEYITEIRFNAASEPEERNEKSQ